MSELAYEDIKVDDEASLSRTITEAHIVNFAGVTGDMEPGSRRCRICGSSRCSGSGLRTACSSRG